MIALQPQISRSSAYRPATKREDARRHLDFLQSSHGLGLQSQDDSEIADAWMLLFGEALDHHEQLPDPYPCHVLSTGATALHVLACMATANNGHDEIISGWLDRIGKERSVAMGSQADCSGRTPFGLALAADLEVSMGYCGGEFGGALRALVDRGLVGASGEAGSILLESLDRQGDRFNGASALRLLPLHKVIQACSLHGVDWLVPLATPNGPIEERSVAIGAIVSKLDSLAMKPVLRAGLEALMLGDQIREMGKGSESPPRL